MPISVDLAKDLLLDCLVVAKQQRSRAAQKFKPGSAAKDELEREAALIQAAYIKIQSEPTPLENAIENKRK